MVCCPKKDPVRFVDLKGKERPYGHAPPPPAQPQQVYEPTEAEQRAAAHAARQHHQATAPIPVVPEDTPAVDETAPEPSAPENVSGTKETTPSQFGPVDDPMDTGLPEWLQPFEPEETDADGDPIGTGPEAGKGEDSIGTGQEATAEPFASDAKRAMAIRMVNTGRQAECLPPLKKPRVHLPRRTGESSSANDSVESSISGDDDLYTECYWSSEVPNDEILFVNKSTNTIVWSRLTENEKSLFDDAKDEAFLKHINRNAWRPAKRATSNSKKTCPIVFVLKWKNGAAHARVCLQGRLNHPVVEQGIAHDVSNWTVVYFSGFGSRTVESFCSGRSGSFLQGMNVEDLGIDIFTDLVGDVRKRLQRLMNLADDEVLKMLK